MKGVREVALGGLLAIAGCGRDWTSPEMMELAREGGVVVSFKGFMFPINDTVSKRIAGRLRKVFVKGDQIGDYEKFYKMLAEADVHGKADVYGKADVPGSGVWFTIHSAGSIPAYGIAQECKKRGIKIRGIHSFDAFTSNTYSTNVERIWNYISSDFYLPGKHESKGGMKNSTQKVKGGHIGLPGIVEPIVEGRMRASQEANRTYRNSSRPVANLKVQKIYGDSRSR